MRVLVTGATSLVGRSLVERLHQRGDEVTVFQRTPSGIAVTENLGDISDPRAVGAAVAGAEAVVHLAARAGVTGRWELFEQANVVGTRCMIEAARAAGVARFVHVSSPSVAHTGRSLVGAGAEPADPGGVRGHYARSKAQAELIALAADSSTMAVTAIRPHLIWGPGDAQLIGRIVERAKAGRLAIVGSGAALIDTTYVDNAADALVAAVDRAPTIGGRVLVVTNGQPPRLKVPYRLAHTGGIAVEQIWERRDRSDDPPLTSFLAEQLGTAHWFDQRETRTALDWEPSVGLNEGFQRLRAHFDSAEIL
jgi:nucleoside-diphosphate-sugar epimerase